MWNKTDFDAITNFTKNIFAEFEDDEFFGGLTKEKVPSYYSKNENGNLLMAIPMPGFAKENIKVHFEGGYLVVEAKTTNWYNTQEYRKQYKLIDCDENSVKAEYKNGVLELIIKKLTQQRRTIQIE